MSAIVFVGLTIPVEEARRIIDAECRPPVAQGDVYRAALCRLRLIGIVDGYFDGVSSVWHKEVLWAMAQGIQVFGSASMGRCGRPSWPISACAASGGSSRTTAAGG